MELVAKEAATMTCKLNKRRTKKNGGYDCADLTINPLNSHGPGRRRNPGNLTVSFTSHQSHSIKKKLSACVGASFILMRRRRKMWHLHGNCNCHHCGTGNCLFGKLFIVSKKLTKRRQGKGSKQSA